MTWLVLILIFVGLSLFAFSGRFSKRQMKTITYVVLVLFAFFYEPSWRADMYRFREALEYMKEYGYEAAYADLWYIYENSQAFFGIMVVLSYLPIQLFFPIALLSTYGIALAIFFDITDSLELTKYQYALVYSFFLCCVNFGIMFSIMRFFMAYLIGLAGIYMWFRKGATIRRRFLAVAMIISATFIHTAGFLISAIWILTLLCYFKPMRIISLIIPFSMLFAEGIIKVTSSIFGNVSLYNTIVDKFFSYSSENYEGMFGRTRLFYYQLVLFIAIVFLITKILKYENKQFAAFNTMYMLMLSFTIAFIPNETQILFALSPMYFAVNKELLARSRVMQIGMLGECVIMLIFYGRLSTYYYL